MDINRIKLNKDWWISFQYDKLVFGGSFLKNGFHLTLPYGLKSKKVDLHLTKDNRHYPILILKHEFILPVLSIVAPNLITSIFLNLRNETYESIESRFTSIIIIQNSDINQNTEFNDQIMNCFNELKSPNSKALKINEESERFSKFVDTLKAKSEQLNDFTEREIYKLKEIENCFGIVKNEEQNCFIIKNSSKITLFDTFHIDLKSVIKATLGHSLTEQLEKRIEQGYSVLESEDYEEIKKDFKPIEIVIQKTVANSV